MSSAAGADNLPRSEIMEEINACVVNICGGCPESGVFLSYVIIIMQNIKEIKKIKSTLTK